MRIVVLEPSHNHGPYARSLRVVEKHLPHAGEDVEKALDELTRDDSIPIPCPPRVSLIPGLGVTVIKVRVKSRDLTKGKSGGLRLLLQRLPSGPWRRLLVYAKGAQEDVSKEEILAAVAVAGPMPK
jgi:hypothetical protein